MLIEREFNADAISCTDHLSLLALGPKAAKIQTIMDGIEAIDPELAPPGIPQPELFCLVSASQQAGVTSGHQDVSGCGRSDRRLTPNQWIDWLGCRYWRAGLWG